MTANSKTLLSKDDVIANNDLRNIYLKYYQDIRCNFINSSSMSVVYPKDNSLAFGYIQFKNLEVDNFVLKDVPYVTKLDGTPLFNDGTNFIIVR